MKNKNFSFYTNISVDQVMAELHTDPNGLTELEVKQRLLEYGKNEIQEDEVTWYRLLINQLINPFMIIFFVLSIAYLGTHQFLEAGLILVMIVINVGIGFYQEYRSNSSMQMLKQCLMSQVTVKRDGSECNVTIDQLVPGDIMHLYAGDIIPADCRFISSEGCAVDESSLTGESVAVPKRADGLPEMVSDIHKAENIGFTGTVVVEGKGVAVVIATGLNSALGTIAKLANASSTQSCLEKGSASIAKVTLYLIIFSLIAVAAIHIIIHKGKVNFVDLLLFSAALAVTAIPEGLPMVITFCLSQGAASLKKNNVIVKRLSAIGDLGSIDVFCTDKTGTLTENALSVSDIYGNNPDNTLIYAIISSPSQTATKESPIKGFDLALQKKLTAENKQELELYKKVKETPFTPQKRQCWAVVEKGSIHTLIVKGSSEVIVPKCTFLGEQEKETVHSWITQQELQGNRILAVATKNSQAYDNQSYDIEQADHDYETLGLIAFQDPLKSTALSTIEKARSLAVDIKIISGDSKNVCYAIAKQLGLEDNSDNIVLGADFEKSSEEQKTFLANNRSVFARVNPEQKYQIIRSLQKEHAVGYMGDGINDAPALKIAHVSFAVNDAAPVAREAAEIILLRKSLSSVILGIEEGRKTIVNTLKYTKMTNAPSFGHFYALAIASLLLSYPPMLPIQLLFLNLLTDLPMIAISTDSVSFEEIQKPITYDMKDATILICLFALIMLFADLVIFAVFKSHFPATLQTSWFITSTVSEIIFIFLFRTRLLFFRAHRPSLILIGLSVCAVLTALTLPFTTFGQKIFMFSPPKAEHFPWLIGVVVFNLIVAEGVKLTYYYFNKK